jgi:hypothetical protein
MKRWLRFSFWTVAALTGLVIVIFVDGLQQPRQALIAVAGYGQDEMYARCADHDPVFLDHGPDRQKISMMSDPLRHQRLWCRVRRGPRYLLLAETTEKRSPAVS